MVGYVNVYESGMESMYRLVVACLHQHHLIQYIPLPYDAVEAMPIANCSFYQDHTGREDNSFNQHARVW